MLEIDLCLNDKSLERTEIEVETLIEVEDQDDMKRTYLGYGVGMVLDI